MLETCGIGQPVPLRHSSTQSAKFQKESHPYLAVGLELPFATGLLGSWFGYIGPVLVLLGLFLAGVATLQGYKGTVVKDK